MKCCVFVSLRNRHFINIFYKNHKESSKDYVKTTRTRSITMSEIVCSFYKILQESIKEAQ